MRRPAVFLDRDGTLIDERGYLSDPRKIRFYRSALAGLRRLQKAGYRLVVITNQSGVGRGYFTLETLKAINRRFTSLLKARGIAIDGIYFCPHLPDAGCPCRKPKPALPRRAGRELRLDLKRSFVVGDQARDVEMAARIGARGVLVLTGGGRSARARARPYAAKVASNLDGAARWILAQ